MLVRLLRRWDQFDLLVQTLIDTAEEKHLRHFLMSVYAQKVSEFSPTEFELRVQLLQEDAS